MNSQIFRSALLIAGGVSLSVPGFGQNPGGPYLGVLTGNEVYLRTGGSRNHPTFGVIKKGQTLIVDRDENGWCKVHLPRWIPVYVHKDYITLSGSKGRVHAGQLNIRAFPRKGGMDECVGSISEGGSLDVIASEGEWLRVIPPLGTFGYISRQYISKGRSISSADLVKERELLTESSKASIVHAVSKGSKGKAEAIPASSSSPHGADAPRNSFSSPALLKGEALIQDVLKRELANRDYSPARDHFKEIKDSSEDRAEVAAAEEQLTRIAELEDRDETRLEAQQSIAEVQRRNQELEDMARQASRTTRRVEADPYLARGWVSGMGRHNGNEGSHRLLKGSQVLYFLKSEEGNMISLDHYLNKRVGVKGTVRELDPKFGAKLIIVKEIEVLSDR
jgi:hypothetical protein